MRIISGKYKGRKLEGFTLNGTRPTMDRVKESMFAMIQTHLKDSVVLDLFAGSGALGIEAISNSAKICYFVDHSKEAVLTIQKNTKDITNKEIIQKDSLQVLDEFKNRNIQFDIIFLDPPYHESILNKAIDKILKNDLLKPNGLLVCEVEEEKVVCNLDKIKEKQYGEKTVEIYQKR